MEAFIGHKTDTIWFRNDAKIVHKWTYDDIDVEFDELYYIKDGKMVELDLKFYENKEGTFINQYNDEVVIRLTNEYNKLCVFFEIDNVDYHNKPTEKEFKQYVEDFKAQLLGVYEFIYELKKFEEYYYNNIDEVMNEQFIQDELSEIKLEEEYYYEVDISDSEEEE